MTNLGNFTLPGDVVTQRAAGWAAVLTASQSGNFILATWVEGMLVRDGEGAYLRK